MNITLVRRYPLHAWLLFALVAIAAAADQARVRALLQTRNQTQTHTGACTGRQFR